MSSTLLLIAMQQNIAYTSQVCMASHIFLKGGRNMTARPPTQYASPTLHVFEQEGGWHWGITIPRSAGSGFKVIAYSETTFTGETEARRDGSRALDSLPDVAAFALVR
jgi:hypothetical protein